MAIFILLAWIAGFGCFWVALNYKIARCVSDRRANCPSHKSARPRTSHQKQPYVYDIWERANIIATVARKNANSAPRAKSETLRRNAQSLQISSNCIPLLSSASRAARKKVAAKVPRASLFVVEAVRFPPSLGIEPLREFLVGHIGSF